MINFPGTTRPPLPRGRQRWTALFAAAVILAALSLAGLRIVESWRADEPILQPTDESVPVHIVQAPAHG